MSKRRVVVTGLGAVTPIGNNVEDFWAGIREGKVGIGPITKFDTTEYKVKIAAEVKDFNVKERLDNKAARRMEVFSQYAVAASREAFDMAGLDMAKEDPYRVGVIIGSGIGGLALGERGRIAVAAGVAARAAVCAGQAGTNFGKARVLLDRHDARRHGEADRADEADHSHGQNRDQNFHHSRALLSRTAGR